MLFPIATTTQGIFPRAHGSYKKLLQSFMKKITYVTWTVDLDDDRYSLRGTKMKIAEITKFYVPIFCFLGAIMLMNHISIPVQAASGEKATDSKTTKGTKGNSTGTMSKL